jgi:hypothetical protein
MKSIDFTLRTIFAGSDWSVQLATSVSVMFDLNLMSREVLIRQEWVNTSGSAPLPNLMSSCSPATISTSPASVGMETLLV